MSDKLYSAKQSQKIDRAAIDTYQQEDLMQRAGVALFEHIKTHYPQTRHLGVICGKGNNGGDGFVLAHLAHKIGLKVSIWAMQNLEEYEGEAAEAADLIQDDKIQVQPLDETTQLDSDVNLLVDGLLGTGASGAIKQPYLHIIRQINAHPAPVVAIDIPSGLNPDTGSTGAAAVLANSTLSLVCRKAGLYTNDGPEHSGLRECADLEVPEEAYKGVDNQAELLDLNTLQERLPQRRHRNAHKGHFGNVLVIAGDKNMPGAARIAAEAAARMGAGTVTLATHPQHSAIISTTRPEIICSGIENTEQIYPLLKRATVLVVGSGMGETAWSHSMLRAISQSNLPKVIDAGALDFINHHEMNCTNAILTPHPGEAARLLGCSISAVQRDRFAAVRKLQKRFKGIVILKGCGTLIHSHYKTFICDAGNPGMASGGMGDLLSGIIGGLLTQGLSPQQAACLGVMLHAHAGDQAAEKQGERGLLAMDLLPYCR